MFTYEFSRELVEGSFNIDNKFYKDVDGKIIPLAKYLLENMPSRPMNVRCGGTLCKISSATELNAAEITQLTNLVNAYKEIR